MKGFIVSLLSAGVLSSNTLYNLYSLQEGEKLDSLNEIYSAVLQTDGNFVVLKNPDQVIWQTSTTNDQGALYLKP